MTKARTTIGLLAAATLAASGYFAHQHLTTPTAPMEAITLYNPGSPREVAGSADDIFHGTVLRRAGRRTIDDTPSDRYEVRVGHVFKGRLSGTVTVTQPVEEAPLTAGKRYVFTTAAWKNPQREHAVLSDTRPTPAAQLDSPSGAGQTIAQLWQHAVDHQIDVTPNQ
ncbi:hypothetical protein AR457_37590 [Streptomyces agglomeratus]|uniref:hypothetical protein n=1 Tax=Streptomyces agglomeratus TaxID=285458 RepID=UPI0008550C6D|nr:hypothetical protein [Streptomyces agglomeratus]OEJ22932.1 hypothetical protein AR457_37590 [Streptomyces agglomeratus]